jgi:hypothetical protein
MFISVTAMLPGTTETGFAHSCEAQKGAAETDWSGPRAVILTMM